MSARSESGFGGHETVTVLALYTVLLLIGIGIADLLGFPRMSALIPAGILVGGVVAASIIMNVRDRRRPIGRHTGAPDAIEISGQVDSEPPVADRASPQHAADLLRVSIRTRKRDFWWIALFWFIPLLGLVACGLFDAPSWLWVLAGIAFVSGVIQHGADLIQYSDWKRLLAKLEGTETGKPPRKGTDG